MDTAKVLGFGQSHITGGTGTFAHLAPEQVTDFTATAKTDIWGLGCVLHWLIMAGSVSGTANTSLPKVMHVSAIREGVAFVERLRSELAGTSSGRHHAEFVELVADMLAYEMDDRPDATRCLFRVEKSAAGRKYNIHTCTCTLPRASQFVTTQDRTTI